MRKYLVVSFILFISSVNITSAHTFHGAAMAPNTLKGWVVRSDTGLVFHTPDCGITWINQSFLFPLRFMDVFFLNEQKGWIISEQGFVFYSPNGGQNWYLQRMGLAKRTSRIFFINDTCGWAACAQAIIGRTIRGNDTVYHFDNWQQICLPNPPFPSSIWFNGVSFLNTFKGWVCAGRYPEYWYSRETVYTRGQGYIATSTDSGLNWQLLLRDTVYDFFDIKFQDSLNGFVVGGNDRTMSAVVMKTQNGGMNWQNVTIPSQAKYLRSLKFQGNHAWAVGHNGTILHSDDGGNTWALQTCPIDTTLYDIDFSDSIHGLIAGDGCVLYTHNGGLTWNIANLGIEEIVDVIHDSRKLQLSLERRINPVTTMFSVTNFRRVNLILYDINGKLIKTLVQEPKKPGTYKISLNIKSLSSGVYFLQLRQGNEQIAERLVIVK